VRSHTGNHRSCPDSAQRSALADLCVYAVGHELAAIKLCGHAAAQCTDRTGRMLLVDLALERIQELSNVEGCQDGLAAHLPRLEHAELERLLQLRSRSQGRSSGRARGGHGPHPRPSIKRLRLVGELLSALREFDAQAELLLRSMSALVPEGPSREVAVALQRSKARWIRLTDEIADYLAHLGEGGAAAAP
jgi:hypothetical protein